MRYQLQAAYAKPANSATRSPYMMTMNETGTFQRMGRVICSFIKAPLFAASRAIRTEDARGIASTRL